MHRNKLAMVLALAVAVTGGTTGLAVPPAHAAITAPVSVPSIHPATAQTVSIAAKAVNQQKITTNNLNLRQGKSTGTRLLLTIAKNSRVTVTETSGSWSKTSYKDKTRWVASAYLKNAATAPRPATGGPPPPSTSARAAAPRTGPWVWCRRTSASPT